MKKIIFFINIFLLFNCQKIYSEIYEVDNSKIVKLIKNGVPLIDIRTESEWKQTGIINQSKTLTFFDRNGNYDVKDWISKLKKIATEKDPLIIICRSGRRSRIVANYLNSKAGYIKIYHATKGILSWKNEKRKIVTFP